MPCESDPTTTHWTVLVRSAIGGDGRPVLHALRTALGALAEDIQISLFFLEDGLPVLRSPSLPEFRGYHDLLEEIQELGGRLHAIDWNLDKENPYTLLPGIEVSTMAKLIRSIKESDQVISF